VRSYSTRGANPTAAALSEAFAATASGRSSRGGEEADHLERNEGKASASPISTTTTTTTTAWRPAGVVQHGGVRDAPARSPRVVAAAAARAARATLPTHAAPIDKENVDYEEQQAKTENKKSTSSTRSGGSSDGGGNLRRQRQQQRHTRDVADGMHEGGASRRRREHARIAAENVKLHARLRAVHGRSDADLLAREAWGQVVAHNVAHAAEPIARRHAAARLVGLCVNRSVCKPFCV
jgi:hypothetical protein